MDAAAPNPLAALTHEDVVAACSSKSGKHWTKVMQAIMDYGVDGAWIGQHVQSVQTLHSFLEEELEVDGPKKAITRQLRELLLRSADNAASGRGADLGEPPADGCAAAAAGAHDADRGGGGHKVAAAVLTSVRVQFTPSSRADDGGGGTKQITLGVPSPAPPRTVVRCLLDAIFADHSHAQLETMNDSDIQNVAQRLKQALMQSPSAFEDNFKHIIAHFQLNNKSKAGVSLAVALSDELDDADWKTAGIDKDAYADVLEELTELFE